MPLRCPFLGFAATLIAEPYQYQSGTTGQPSQEAATFRISQSRPAAKYDTIPGCAERSSSCTKSLNGEDGPDGEEEWGSGNSEVPPGFDCETHRLPPPLLRFDTSEEVQLPLTVVLMARTQNPHAGAAAKQLDVQEKRSPNEPNHVQTWLCDIAPPVKVTELTDETPCALNHFLAGSCSVATTAGPALVAYMDENPAQSWSQRTTAADFSAASLHSERLAPYLCAMTPGDESMKAV
jgi:hypothetical protein